MGEGEGSLGPALFHVGTLPSSGTLCSWNLPLYLGFPSGLHRSPGTPLSSSRNSQGPSFSRGPHSALQGPQGLQGGGAQQKPFPTSPRLPFTAQVQAKAGPPHPPHPPHPHPSGTAPAPGHLQTPFTLWHLRLGCAPPSPGVAYPTDPLEITPTPAFPFHENVGDLETV